MGVYTSKMRYTGTSGVDVESMVESLMKAEGMKADKLYKQKTKLEWQQSAMRTMGLSIKGFKSNYLTFGSTSTITNMRSANTFAARSISGSFSGGSSMTNGATNSTINVGINSTITATTELPTGDYKVKINSVATKEAYRGKSVGGSATSAGKLDVSTIEEGDYIDMTVNGTKKRITFTADDIAKFNTGVTTADNDAFVNVLNEKMDTTFGKVTATGETESKGKVKASLDGDGNLVFTANADIGATFSLTQDSSVTNAVGTTSTNSILSGATYTVQEQTMNNADGKDVYKIDGKTIEVAALPKDATDEQKKNYKTILNSEMKLQGINATTNIDADGKVTIEPTTFNTAGKDTYTIDGKEVTVEFTEGSTKATYLANLNSALAGTNVTASLDSEGKLSFTPTNGVDNIKITAAKRETVSSVDPDTGKVTYNTATTIDGVTGTLTANSSAITKIGFDTTNLSSSLNTSAQIGVAGSFTIGGKEITVTEDMTYRQLMDKVNATGVATLNFNSTSNTFKLESTKEGENGKIDIGGAEANSIFEKIGIKLGEGPTTEAKSAEVEITGPDGVPQKIIRETNTFSYGGMNFKLDSSLQNTIDNNKLFTDSDGNLTNPTGAIETTISVKSDTSSVYDSIKQFINDYNTMVDALKSATTTKPAKSGSYENYEPLTEEEKQGLSDSEVEKLEKKAQEGILYRNPELERLQRTMREAMNSTVTLEDGTKMSLGSIGIGTGEYQNGGKLFIHDEEKLRAALENNPDGVAAVFTDSKNGVSEKLVKAIDEAVGSEGYITTKAGFEDSVYSENNYYSKLIKTKQQDLDELYDYLAEKENHYYKMFAAMEAAITQSNNDMATLSSYS